MNGKPSLDECASAFLRIVDLLDGEFDPDCDDDAHDGVLRQVSDIATGFFRDLQQEARESFTQVTGMEESRNAIHY